MALSTSIPVLVAIIGSGSKITSSQIQGSQLKVVFKVEVEVEMISKMISKTKPINVLTQMLPLTELP